MLVNRVRSFMYLIYGKAVGKGLKSNITTYYNNASRPFLTNYDYADKEVCFKLVFKYVYIVILIGIIVTWFVRVLYLINSQVSMINSPRHSLLAQVERGLIMTVNGGLLIKYMYNTQINQFITITICLAVHYIGIVLFWVSANKALVAWQLIHGDI